MAVTIKRAIQLPLSDIDFSKNIVDITVTEDDPATAQRVLNQLFADQMEAFKTGLGDIKEYAQAISALKVLNGFLHTEHGPILKAYIASLKKDNLLADVQVSTDK